ncbi:sulfurtransferase [Actinoplanes couchii]|uniref:Sulfurtransferase n=1 Tax=Actinoplanes couchii TaxID=403638 RepID=A0ABQ3XMA5_9ACTN|nr:rhodanese-like domain-containing protein [Actinoplanes couchii]MDR6321542.1 thiosulfate/3-mercaptopyruvate sulfurtransferase [Actinoplanes couchii]GID59639.1 sulfurtransferase [Actinoplanes couchii]
MTGPLVSVAWLREHLDDVVLLDASIDRTTDGFASGLADFTAEHLPGARFADIFAAFSDPGAPFLFTMPAVGALEKAATSLGVRDGAQVVVYDRNGGAWAARIWWLLRVHGFTSVYVLDGGLAAWAGPLESGPPEAPAVTGELTLREPGPVTADFDEVTRTPGDKLVCALRTERFDAGHIPGSVSLPYNSLLYPDGTLDVAAVRSRAAGIGLDATSVVYCGGGINAAGLILALDAAGLPLPRMYDGSLSEWRTRRDIAST